MSSLLWGWYGQIWPNLVASAITGVPLFAWHHKRIKAHITATAAAQTLAATDAAVPGARTVPPDGPVS